MDSTLFENKPFRDIAEYLASNGIAVIRYDKRNFAHSARVVREIRSFTVYEESIEDAILAADILKADPRIDENKVYIIGLSLGGMLAPRIHAEGGDFAGIISLAGSPRRWADIWHDQHIAQINRLPDGNEQKIAALEKLDEEMHYLNSFSGMTDEEAKQILFLGASGYYFKDMDANPVSKFVQNMTTPFLIMQGGKDVQVLPETDFAAWQELLAERDNATFKLYDNLNHLFMRSRLGTALEYRIKDTVDSQALADIAEWILNPK
jgi:hypothetical protein